MNAPTRIDADTTFTPAEAGSTPLPLRAHTILGVCEALGEDFGIDPLWFRVPFGASVLVSPLWAVVAYFAVGLVVFGSRLLAPDVKPVAIRPKAAVNAADNDSDLKLAA